MAMRLSVAAETVHVRDGLQAEPFWLWPWIPDADGWANYAEGEVPGDFSAWSLSDVRKLRSTNR